MLLETTAILQNRIGLEATRRFNDDMRPVFTVEWINAARHEKGVSAVLAADRRRLSLVDCVSFDVMRERGIRIAFAFDEHFVERGFHPPSVEN